MALDRFKNIEEVEGYTPTYGTTFNDGIDAELKPLTVNDVDGTLAPNVLDKLIPNMERHVYSANNLLKSSYRNTIPYTLDGSYPLVTLRPEEDIRNDGYEQGVYSIVYNFLHKVNEAAKVTGISGDRTEVRLSLRDSGTSNFVADINTTDNKVISSDKSKTGLSNIPTAIIKESLLSTFNLPNGSIQIVQPTTPNNFDVLKDLYFQNANTDSTFTQNRPDFVLNLSENNLIDISAIYFDQQRIGLEEVRKSYPNQGGRYNHDGGTPISTTYVPLDRVSETLGSFREFIEIYTPAVGEQNIKVTDEKGNKFLAAGRQTGRWRRFSLYYDDNNQLQWNGARTFDLNDGDDQLPQVDESRAIRGIETGKKTGIDLNKLYLTYKKFNPNFAFPVKDVVVKLTQPLPDNIVENNLLSIDARIKESWIEKLVAFPSVVNVDRPDFSVPNFELDMSDKKGADATDWQNWDSLLDVNATTSQQLVSKYFSGSLGDVKLNIDYSDFNNYIHFSSATERVDNFLYKIKQIESYNSRIDVLDNVSGSAAITNISQSIVRRDTLIGGFDDFENHLYYSTQTNNYTHWSSSAYTIGPYPKQSTFPHVLRSSTSDEAVTWYNNTYASASLYDEFNDSALRNMIPIHLKSDPQNSEYVTFVDMIGQHFDIQWTYITALTSINKREEHFNDGMPDELLQSVAESLGWKLSNGYSDTSLWKYALGVDRDGSKSQTGILESKSREQITHEVWRRIVNSIPMLYKTKGTARSIKAMLSTYGIPQAFLKIREWGGPTISTRKNVYEHERFVYKLQASPSKYISNPWDDIQSDRPNSIEVIGKMPKGNYHILRLSDGGDNVDLFWDYINETARIRLKVNSTDIISSSYVSYKERREVAVSLNSSSIDINAAWVDDWGELLANPTSTLDGNNSTFNSVWTSTGTVQVPGPTTDSNVNSYETASIQEIRYFRDTISNEIITEHAKNREAYFSDDNTTDLDIDTSFDKLMYRIFPDSGFNVNSGSIDSMHPNQKFTSSDSGLVLSASLVNMTPTDLVGEVDTQFVTVPSVGALNLMNNKVRIESASLKGPLNIDKSNEISQYDYAPLDSNLLGTYFSTTDTVNFDIYNSEGYFEADDWVGDPDKRYNEDYPLLKYRAKNYFQKYTTGTSLDLIMDMLSRYDMSVFDQIKQLIPARVDWHKGILIEPHTFERNKFQRERGISISKHYYEGVIGVGTNIITASRHDYGLTSGSKRPDGVVDLYDYSSAEYKFDIATLSGSTYINLTNGYWEYSPTGSTVLEARPSKIYSEPKYFFATAEDAATLTPNSTSFHYTDVQDTRLPLSMENLYYNGCRISSDSLTTDSEDTPDGGPVVEITKVDPNVVIFSGQTGDVLENEKKTKPQLVSVIPSDELISVKKRNEKLRKPAPSRDVEKRTLQPLPFVVKLSKPKFRFRENTRNKLLKGILKRFNLRRRS
jgi:hypothetical protein